MKRPEESSALADLAKVAERRDPAAFERLYDAYSPILYRVCLMILKDEGEAQEALQDVFMHVWERSSGFEASRGKLYTWLCVLTRSKAIDRLRRRARLQRRVALSPDGSLEAALQQAPDPRQDALQLSADAQQARQIRALLATLPAAQVEVLTLAYLEGLSQSEIARRTGRPLGTVKTQMRTATQRLAGLVTAEMRTWL